MPAIGAGIAGAFAAGTTAAAIGGAVLKLALSIALSKLQQAALKRKMARNGGILTEQTVSGENQPEAFILGTYATGGHMVCPPYSHGKKNKYLTYVIEIASHPGVQVQRLIIDNTYVTLAGTSDPTYGRNVNGSYAGKVWIREYDGTQVAADPMMLAKYGGHPERPWTSDMIGAGISYVVLTFVYDENLFRSLPTMRFEVNGMKLYDPRKDSTNGGSGAHLWSNPATWEFTRNPMVMSYNILRGIQMPGGRVWSKLGLTADDLPVAAWFPAMNACDASVTTTAGSEAAYRAGLEVLVTEEPADVLEELKKVCAGEFADLGGIWKAHAGAAPLPVMSLTDTDTLITEPGWFDPFPGMDETFNGVQARYPDPDATWDVKDAPPRFNSVWEASDLGRQLVADLEFPACPYKLQVQRLMKAYIEDERRFRRHQIPLGPEAALLEPLVDTLAWTSAANDYTAKVFEISEMQIDTRTLTVAVSVREQDPADFNWSISDEITVTTPAPAYVGPDPLVVEGFAVAGVSIEDATATARRPGCKFTWTAADEADNDALDYEIRVLATGVMVAQGSTASTDTGELIVSAGLVAATNYEARMRPVIAGMTTVWTSWTTFTTPNTLLSEGDIGLGEVTRPLIDNGAVTDTVQTGVSVETTTSLSLSSGSTATLATLSLPSWGPGQSIWKRAAEVQIRGTNISAGNLELTVELRRAQLGGGFGAWNVVDDVTITSNSFDIKGFSGGLTESCDAAEYRMRVKANLQNITLEYRNLFLTATDTRR